MNHRCVPRSIVLDADQRLLRVDKDYGAKKDVAYILNDRHNEWIVLCQSLPLLARWTNENLSCGAAWDRVSVTGLFDALNRTDGRHGGWHKGRFRVRGVPLRESKDAFEAVRDQYGHAVIVAGLPQRYATFRT